MIQIDDKVVSFDLLEEYFCCDYETCRGACCIEGDCGAPVTAEEVRIINRLLPRIMDRLSPQALEVLRRQGVAYRDPSGDLVTSIVGNKDCVFTTYNSEGGCLCALEQLAAEGRGESGFVKPMSCRLYPIRVKEYRKFTVLNYDRWKICDCARELGRKEGIRVYQFLQRPIEAAWGKEFFIQLEEAARLLHDARSEQTHTHTR